MARAPQAPTSVPTRPSFLRLNCSQFRKRNNLVGTRSFACPIALLADRRTGIFLTYDAVPSVCALQIGACSRIIQCSRAGVHGFVTAWTKRLRSFIVLHTSGRREKYECAGPRALPCRKGNSEC